jgi:hypothetical protein
MSKFDDKNNTDEAATTAATTDSISAATHQDLSRRRMLISPFSAIHAPFQESPPPIIDWQAVQRKDYCMLNLRISHCIEKSTSTPVPPVTNGQYRKRPKNMLHDNNVGTLMVDRKKPFKVRFSDT